MIIEKLIGDNWGKHRHFEFESNGSIVGVVGPNGSGKSTVLDLVEFLITGQTRDNLDSYVRNQQGNGGGSMTFVKNGQRGTIMRQIGSTKKRELVWGDQTLKSVKDVDKLMSEIFGADKKALANSVFVNQGTLQDILFKDGVDRSRAFLQLVNLSFCEARSHMVNSQIQMISGTVVDLTPARDEASAARMDALGTMNRKNMELLACPNHEAELTYLHNLSKANTELNLLQQQIGEALVQKQSKQAELEVKLAGATLDQRIAELEETRQNLESDRTKSDDYGKILAELTHYTRVRTEIDCITRRQIQVMSDLSYVNADSYTVQQIEGFIKDLNDDIKLHDNRKSITETIAGIESNLTHLHNQLGIFPVPPASQDQLNKVQHDLQLKRSSVSQLSQYTRLQAKIKGRVSAKSECTGDCPECGLTLMDINQLNDEYLQGKTAEIELLTSEIKVLEKQQSDWLSALAEYNRKKNNLEGSIESQKQAKLREQQRLADIKTKFDYEVAKEDVRAWSDIREKTKELLTEQSNLDTQKATAIKLLDTFPLGASNWERRYEFSAAGHSDLSSRTTHWSNLYNQRNQQLSLSNNLASQIETITHSLAQMQTRVTEASAIFNAPAPGVLSEKLQDTSVSMTQVESELSAAEHHRISLKGEVKTAVEAYQAANVRFQDLEQRIAQNRAKLDLLNDLRRLKDLLGNDGIPMMFVRHKFEKLAQHTQDGLQQMNANFYIFIDKDKDLEFLFHRLDEPTKFDLPMCKLSGGQRVRLCLAFLMALQKTLIKDIGLLVLDEPLGGLDINGVEQVIEFLSLMKQELKNAEHQIWIVDHNFAIEQALEKELKLGQEQNNHEQENADPAEQEVVAERIDHVHTEA
jgi:DNA repair exonuclease SbcCD ATPase subunit